MLTHEKYMRRCFQLAKLGCGNVSPNPMVGAVIVYNDTIIGEGYHEKYGFAHAEVNAVNSVKDKSLLKDSTIYVSLEPCSHYGKTPPCSLMLKDIGIKRCVVSCIDSNPKVSGRGIKILKDAGIEVITGVLEEEGKYLNRRFFTFQSKHRPYIILKFAQSLDGFVAPNYSPYWITNDALKAYTHKMRTKEDAFLVGANTIIKDNCQMNVRYYSGKNPIRLIYDRDLSLPKDRHFFDDSQKTIIFNNVKESIAEKNTYLFKVEEKENLLPQILDRLYKENIQSLVVEGGKKTLESFIERGLWDEAKVFTGNMKIENGLTSPCIDRKFFSHLCNIGDNKVEVFFNEV